jgi:hypothetical protein
MELTIRCSGLARPMVCAGSLFFTDLPAEEDSAPAKEGTAAGEYLQHLLEGTKDIPTHAKNGVMFDNDIKFFTTDIALEIQNRNFGPVVCEQRLDWQTRSGIWIRGQADVAADDGNDLYIDDLKYGWGIVEAKDNRQLLGYAIGEVMRRQKTFRRIHMTIRQPRPHHEEGPTRTWTLTYEQLLGYKEQIETRMQEIAAGEKRLVTTSKCRYCPAAVKCPALNKAFYRGVEYMHEFMQDDIDEKELSHQLDLVNRVSDILKIKQDSLKALAIDRIKNGAIIPGYINEASYGDRKWKPGISPDVIKTLTGKDVLEQTMLSPAKAEKIGIPKEFVNSLVDRHFLGNKLVKKDATVSGNKIFGATAPKEISNG